MDATGKHEFRERFKFRARLFYNRGGPVHHRRTISIESFVTERECIEFSTEFSSFLEYREYKAFSMRISTGDNWFHLSFNNKQNYIFIFLNDRQISLYDIFQFFKCFNIK